MNELQISNPQGIDFKSSLSDWVKIDNLKKTSFWGRRSGMVAMITACSVGALIVGGVAMNLGLIMLWLGALVAKIIIAAIFAGVAFVLYNDTTRTYLKSVAVGFFETITLEYVRKHPLVAFSAFWAHVVDRINNLQAALSSAKTFHKTLTRDIDGLVGRIDAANGDALKAENNNDEILRNSFLNKAQQLSKTRGDYIQLRQILEGYVEKGNNLLKIANSKKIAIENDIEVYKTKHKFNSVSTDLIGTMRSVIAPDSRILNLYHEAKDSIDQRFDQNLVEMDTIMEQLGSMPSSDDLSNPALLQSAIQQFDQWKQAKSLTTSTASMPALETVATSGVEKKPVKKLDGEIDF